MDRVAIDVPPTHPYATAARLAEQELATLAESLAIGNVGRARVCARRAVGAFLQSIGATLADHPGTHSMANLQFVSEDPRLPVTIRLAAGRLAAGPRDAAAGVQVSTDPLADVLAIINYFVRSASL